MPLYQIVSLSFADINCEDGKCDYNSASLYKMLGKKVSTLLLEGWKCQGGVVPIYEDGCALVELIQAMTYDC